MLLGDSRATGARVSLGLAVGGRRLLEALLRACVSLRQSLLSFLLLSGFDLNCFCRSKRRFSLRDDRILALNLIAQNVDSRLRCRQGGVRQIHLSLVVGGINLNEQVARLDRLEIVDSDG